MMKGYGSPTRHTDGHTVVISLPDPRLLLLIARLSLVAAMLCSIPLLRRNSLRGTMVRSYYLSDDPFCLPLLIRDLKREGLFLSDTQKAIFLGDVKHKLPFLKKNGIDHVPLDQELSIADQSVDFAFSNEGFEDGSVQVLDRVLKIGGIAMISVNSEELDPFRLPSNYNLVYVRRFGCPVVALRKVANANYQNGNGENEIETGNWRGILAMPLVKKDVLNQVEDVLLKPPREFGETRKIKFLPEVMGDPLTQYPRRGFIDAGLNPEANSEKWFEENYPKKVSKFEMVKLNAISNRKIGAKPYRFRVG